MILMYSIITYIAHMRAGCGGWGGLKALMFRDVHKLWHVCMYVCAVGVGCVVGCVYSVDVS